MIDKLQRQNVRLSVENMSLRKDSNENKGFDEPINKNTETINNLHTMQNQFEQRITSEMIAQFDLQRKMMQNMEKNVIKLSKNFDISLINDTLKSMTNEIRDVRSITQKIEKKDEQMENVLLEALKLVQNNNEKLLGKLLEIKRHLQLRLKELCGEEMVKCMKEVMDEVKEDDANEMIRHLDYVLTSPLGPLEQIRDSLNVDAICDRIVGDIGDKWKERDIVLMKQLRLVFEQLMVDKFSWLEIFGYIRMNVGSLVVLFGLFVMVVLFMMDDGKCVNPFW